MKVIGHKAITHQRKRIRRRIFSDVSTWRRCPSLREGHLLGNYVFSRPLKKEQIIPVIKKNILFGIATIKNVIVFPCPKKFIVPVLHHTNSSNPPKTTPGL